MSKSRQIKDAENSKTYFTFVITTVYSLSWEYAAGFCVRVSHGGPISSEQMADVLT